MPRIINDHQYWETRAQESRLLVDLMTDPAAKLTMFAIAESYDCLAAATMSGIIAPEENLSFR